MSAEEKSSNKLQDHLLTLQRLLEQSELSTELDSEIEEEMLIQIEALSDSIEQPSIYTIDDSNISTSVESANEPATVDRDLPILMDKIEIETDKTSEKSVTTGRRKHTGPQRGYETSNDLANNILDALAEIDPYITLPIKGSQDYEKLSAALAKRLEKGFNKPK
ncbi:MAG TPA: hypothetical protein DCY55_03320 [Gammaproteobacteria bacterium]|nr:hypothetical protein [Pseudomonadota bacterium]HAY45296.1 hypothetical protein [Gammaproteobacteria bacterium]